MHARLADLCSEKAGEVLACLGLHARGNFFGQKFEEEVSHARSRHTLKPSGLSLSKPSLS